MNEGYILLYRWLPALFRIPYLISKKSLIRNLSIKSYNLQKAPRFEREIQKYQPVACISTYFMCTQTLSMLKSKYEFQLINLVANPWTIHPIEITDQGVNCVLDQPAAATSTTLSPTANIQKTGWFVRPEFFPVADKKQARAALALEPELLTFTLVAGSEGNHHALSILPHLLKLNLPLQVVVVCGSSKLLLRRVNDAIREHPSKVKVKPLGYIKELAPYLQVADLILGKAGPNTLFEAVAVETPFFALSHISGQEDGNLDIIREYKIGYVEENTTQATLQLEKLIRNPDALKEFQPALKQLAGYNKQAQARLIALINQPSPS